MTAIGILCDLGMLDVRERIADIFAREIPQEAGERWREVTVEHALTHTIGFRAW